MRPLACVGLLAVVAAACAGADEDAAEPTTTTTSTSATTSASATEAEPRPSAGCGSAALAAGAVVEEERTLTVEGADRRYLLTVPSEHDGSEPLPVVLDFHGLLEGAEVHARMSQYSSVAEEDGFVAVFPHGTGDPLGWRTSLDPATNGDLAYFDAVLEQVASQLCIDEARVYATGLSNGAMFTSALLCQRADVLAAAAPVAGITDPDGCAPSRPVPIVSFHGTADPILLFNGGVDVSAIPGVGEPDTGPTTTAAPVDLDGEGYPANVAAFAARNGCEPEPVDTELTDEVVHRVYDCPPGADVELYIVIDGGHSWPSSEFSRSIGDIVGPTTFDIDATRDAWEFMRRFTSPGG
ncbi:MAG: alpha/beta hydrolase family esterase [Acidimicrobiales bacterium]